MEKFAENFEDLRLEKGVSLNDIQDKTNISTSQLSSFRAGGNISIKNAIKLAQYFDCSLDYLFGISEDKKKRPCPNLEYSKEVFLEKYDKLLKENNVTHYKFSQNRFSESRIRGWRKGQIPSMEILEIIAKGLSSSIDYLLSK